ncbi:DUF2170 family protein [Enterobacter bugandensis]|uniref:YjfI family protein n=1 Tax=Enterobacter bugandensis TaxID=881260 RepID=UPI001B8EF40C|nr:DUF2170 family protein [Enterobacter bugandensis]MCK6859972.1 DUF2170 family protein [Enterobacter bugandensis]MCM7278036.1 DUF2170 family protein [Enterobacter bugandensis]HBC7434329.1 DUF2170 family protein [Enterobacter bugandensis]
MRWSLSSLADELSRRRDIYIDLKNNNDVLIIKMNEYGDLPLSIFITSQQIIIETYICPVNDIKRQADFNLFLLRNQKMLPLSSVGISQIQHDEYYVAFGALSVSSSLEDIILEITTLAANALDLAELTQEFIN